MIEGSALREHTLNRLGYGQSDWHVTRYDELGFDAYVAQQLSGSLPAVGADGATAAAKLNRSILERRQLEVMLIDFWFNHFNVDATGGLVERMVGNHQNVAIKPYILGRFGDMLLATAKSPSMLHYLDNRVNFEEETVNGREYGLNENYARELMELHTLGVDGGYAEADIIEVARVLTGWSVSNDAYSFKSARHDQGAKTIMGVNYPAGRAEDEGVELLAWLAANNSTATFISSKLCKRLVSETPSSAVVEIGAAAFRNSGGDLRAVVQAIIMSADFKADASFRAKVKPPHRYLASAVQAMGATQAGQFSGLSETLLDGIGDLGEEPYKVAPPTGYPEASGYWISSTSMLGRFQLAGAIAANDTLRNRLKAVAGTDGSAVEATVDAVAAHICAGGVSSTTRDAAIGYVSSHATNNNERVTDAAHAILSSPEFVRF